MSSRPVVTVDGNEAVASTAYRINEVIAIYPITPSSNMGESSDAWAVEKRPNIWGQIPRVVEMQSEGGAAGALHGSLQTGALTTTFTASQGLLLMIPNLYKIAGELTAMCIHVAARTIATHALSIFGDHSDVMACRQIGLGLLASGSVQEAHDMACIGQASSLATRVPFLHFFDGFRTSHEVAKIFELSDGDLRHMMDPEAIQRHRERALTPERPVLRGTAQNPDVFFQAREACNGFYDACPDAVQAVMDRFGERTGRQYKLFDYVGHPEAERVVVLMGSGAETAHETVEWMVARGERVGLLKVRLYRPFSAEAFIGALPATVRGLAILDRTKEPGSLGEPLYQDVVAALHQMRAAGASPFAQDPVVVGGRYGLSSKEFTPAMVQGVFSALGKDKPRHGFTVGIVDDVTHTSVDYDAELDIEPDEVFRGVFYGLGADGTVGANKNTIKIIGEETDLYAQGYFVYDSKKSGAMTVSHIRFGKRPLRSTYLVRRSNFVGCHQWGFLEKYDMLECAVPGAVFLLNAPMDTDQVWSRLPREVQKTIIEKKIRLFAIDAYKVADETGMGRRINTIMQTCFFAISGVLPRDEALEHIKGAIKKTYASKGEEVVRRNFEAVDQTLANLHQVEVPEEATSTLTRPPVVSPDAPDFVQRLTAVILAGKGDLLPVSAFPVDGTWPTGTARWEKRSIALEVPVWDEKICIQCNKCAMMCPHAAIRMKVVQPPALSTAPEGFVAVKYRGKDLADHSYTLQVAPDDCTGCGLCVKVCPAKDKGNPRHKAIDMIAKEEVLERQRRDYAYFLDLPEVDRSLINLDNKGSQLLEPLFEYSGACSGCGETQYVRLLTQFFGDRILIANATGCSSIYGGNLPTTPYTVNSEGRGPAWSNSLFEDNAEFGYGFRLALDSHRSRAEGLTRELAGHLGDELVDALLAEKGIGEADIANQRDRVRQLRAKLGGLETPAARELYFFADHLVRKSVWIVGGDGWAYDIGYGGLDHVLASGENVNVLVLDTEVYSNTGGQASKATPIGAAAKFAIAGKATAKKDLGLLAMSYGHVYVASIAVGAKDQQTVRAFLEADAYPGPSLIIAYSPCIAHGYDLVHSADQATLAVNSGIWPLYRFDPRRAREGVPPLVLDSGKPRVRAADYMRNETRFRMVERVDKKRFRWLAQQAQRNASQRVELYQQLAGIKFDESDDSGKGE